MVGRGGAACAQCGRAGGIGTGRRRSTGCARGLLSLCWGAATVDTGATGGSLRRMGAWRDATWLLAAAASWDFLRRGGVVRGGGALRNSTASGGFPQQYRTGNTDEDDKDGKCDDTGFHGCGREALDLLPPRLALLGPGPRFVPALRLGRPRWAHALGLVFLPILLQTFGRAGRRPGFSFPRFAGYHLALMPKGGRPSGQRKDGDGEHHRHDEA